MAALALVALLAGGAQAVVYNYVDGGQNWNTTTAATPTQAGWNGTAACGSGTQQSPINIPDTLLTYDPTLAPLQVSYGLTEEWTMEVTANYMEVADIVTSSTNDLATANAFSDGFVVDGTFVPLNQFHFHTPSEHTYNGVHFPLEMHMVHKLFQASATNTTIVPANTAGAVLAKAAVIGVVFAYDPADADGAFMAKLMPVFDKINVLGADSSDAETINSTDTTTTGNGGNQFFNLTSDVFGVIGTSDYYRYNGSLTTPGCNQGINWFNMAQPMYLSSRQLLAFTSLLALEQGGNGRGADNRLIQPLNGRMIRSSIPPQPPIVVSGTLQFNTIQSADDMSDLEDPLVAGLASVLTVPSSAINIVSCTDVPGPVSPAMDVTCSYTVAAPTVAAANQISGLIAQGAVVATGATTSSLVAALMAASPDLGIQSVIASPATSTDSDPFVAYTTLTNSLLAMQFNVTAQLNALQTSMQSNLTAQLNALQTAVQGRRTPATAPPSPSSSPSVVTGGSVPVYITLTHTITGYTSATFGTAQAAQFENALAGALGISTAAITIVSVTDVPAGRRHALQTGAGVNVQTVIASTSGTSANAITASLSTVTAATLQAAGLVACTGLTVAVPPAVEAVQPSAPPPLDVASKLPATQPEPVPSSDKSDVELNGLFALLFLPVAAIAFGAYHVSKTRTAAAAAARQQSPPPGKMEFLQEEAPRTYRGVQSA